MDNNLIPPFIMKEAGIEVSKVAKIHVSDPSISDHSIYFKDHDLRIPLALWGIFSYFPTRKPTEQDMEDCELILLSPDGPEWNPHSDVFACNEEKFLDWRGDIIGAKDRQRVLIEDSDADAFVSSLSVAASDYGPEKNAIIDKVCDGATVMAMEAKAPDWDNRNIIEDEVSPSLCRISNTLDPE